MNEIDIDPMACQTSHNFRFISDLLDLENPVNGYLCLNIDNPFFDCINVLTIDNDNINNKLKCINHCPAAPLSAYEKKIALAADDDDVMVTSSSLIQLFYKNIITCLLKDIEIINSSNFYVISFSSKFSSEILSCTYYDKEFCDREMKLMKNTGTTTGTADESLLLFRYKALGTPHFCHIGGGVRGHTFNYLVQALYQTRQDCGTKSLKDVLAQVCTQFKEYNASKYTEMNRENILYYYCNRLLRINYFPSVTTTEECATNLEIVPNDDTNNNASFPLFKYGPRLTKIKSDNSNLKYGPKKGIFVGGGADRNCKYESCQATPRYANGYCKLHKNGVLTYCCYVDAEGNKPCQATPHYANGYCKLHKDGVLTYCCYVDAEGNKPCQATPHYKNGYCVSHGKKARNAIKQWL